MGRASGGPIIDKVKKILIATDGSTASYEAVEFGVELAEQHDAVVVLVHVVPPPDQAGLGLLQRRPEPSERDRQALEDAETVAARHGVTVVTKVLSGDAVDEIVACADNLDADLIVVGSRGRGAPARALLGSVSHGVLTESTRPVALVGGRAGAGSAVRSPQG
jgi:nucleotide-binding universal stress UspA family protein